MKKKKLILAISLVLVAMVAVGGTLAWLAAQTQTVTNTFTAGDINIKLTETGAVDTNEDGKVDSQEFKMIPGSKLTKDPKVTVEKGSEASWVFVKIQKINNADTFLDYGIAEGWIPLTGFDGVYYREVAATTADVEFTVLADDIVTVKSGVTKEQLNALTDGNYPQLVFTAYAIQKDNIETAAKAWEEFNK